MEVSSQPPIVGTTRWYILNPYPDVFKVFGLIYSNLDSSVPIHDTKYVKKLVHDPKVINKGKQKVDVQPTLVPP
jgi:hypothetical protein